MAETVGEATTERIGDADWWRTAVVYQVYPRSFSDSDGDGVGDLAGVRGRLPYLHELGVDAIWFTPWYSSPLADGGYDVADYRTIDPVLGSLEEAELLIVQARELGIRTIVDIVPNHVSDRHAWFQDALAAAPGSPERDRFWFRQGRGVDGSLPPTDWESSFGGGTWTRTTDQDGTPGEWYLHLFAPEQPDLNWQNADVRAEHEDVLRFWFDRGAAGVRIDSAGLPVKDPSLPDMRGVSGYGAGEHPHLDRDELHDIYRAWRRVADSYDEPRVLVAEVWLADADRFAAYLRPDEIHTAFNFDFMTGPWRADAVRAVIDATLRSHAPVGAPATWVLSNHDITRPVTRLGRAETSFSFDAKRFGTPTDRALGERRARAAALLAAGLPGVLYVYQGDELGLPEVEDLPRESITDPMHFRSGGVDPGRDGCRVPLPWTSTGSAFGFSPDGASTTPWLPQPRDWGPLSVQAQSQDPSSMLSLYRSALRLRRAEPALRSERFSWVPQRASGVLSFARGDDLICIVNFGPHDHALEPDADILLASAPLVGGALPPDTAVWLRRRPGAAHPAPPETALHPSDQQRS
ncbi:glycoside hydrolase family 13 protein [Humibacter sp. RRB41]|uniref:glycoside hydrolase family 13 protein n=1 Tax=Humibacter sp. RRB41 TaxID=2919946 RepID=UPI001FAA96F2|nr:glycoside hydrolase family 13 protein [Humibacter sp. RRB41]